MAKKKQKSKLERLAENKVCNKSYETTLSDCKLWFGVLNQEVFGGKLQPVDEIDIRRRTMAYAYYTCLNDTKNPDNNYTKLHMSNKYKNKWEFVETLAHELVHHYQFLNDEPLNHGPTFYKWKDKLNRKGLSL